MLRLAAQRDIAFPVGCTEAAARPPLLNPRQSGLNELLGCSTVERIIDCRTNTNTKTTVTNNSNAVFSSEEIAGWPEGSDEFVEAFAEGLAVIGAFGEATGSLTIAEIAERTGMPRAGVRRLLLTLVRVGLAEQASPRFRLTAKAMRFGFAYLSSLGFPEIAQPLIERLAREVNELIALSVLDGAYITYVARAEVRQTLDRSLSIGARLPAFATSMGRVLLAELDKPSLERALGPDRLQRFSARRTPPDLP